MIVGAFSSMGAPVKCAKTAIGSATTTTVVSYDCSSASEVLGAIDNCQLYVAVLVVARAGASVYYRATRGRSFGRESGTLAVVDATAFILGTDWVDATLVGMGLDIDVSSNTIRARLTSVGAINCVAQFFLGTTAVP